MMESLEKILTVWLIATAIGSLKKVVPISFYKNNRARLLYGPFYKEILTLHLDILMKTRSLPPEYIIEIQNILLRKLILSTKQVPWWNDYFRRNNIDPLTIRAVEDLRKIPPTKKEYFLDAAIDDCLAKNTDKDLLITQKTSGTTGMPFKWYVDEPTFQVNTAAYYLRLMKQYGIDFPQISKRPFLVFFNFSSSNRPLQYFVKRYNWSRGRGNSKKELEEIFTDMVESGPCVLATYPTELQIFIEELKKTRFVLPIKLVRTVGQPISKRLREEVRSALQCEVANVYSSKEITCIATECPNVPGEYHVESEHIILECLDECNDSVPDGVSGLITLTCLDNTSAPLIRYQLGDIGRYVARERCVCGSNLPRITFEGRTIDVIRFSDGTWIPMRHIRNNFLGKALYGRIYRYQVIQESLDKVRVRLMPKELPLNKREISSLKNGLENTCDNKISFVIEQAEELVVHGAKFLSFIPLR